jgi:hypothetical protein
MLMIFAIGKREQQSMRNGKRKYRLFYYQDVLILVFSLVNVFEDT